MLSNLPALAAYHRALAERQRLETIVRRAQAANRAITPEARVRRSAKAGATRRRKLDALAEAMHRDYSAGLSLARLAVIYKHDRGSIRIMLQRRGFAIRPPRGKVGAKLPNGQFAKAVNLTDAQLEALIAASTRVTVPEPLKREWRHWAMARRRWFIERLRAALPHLELRPEKPFSANVEPFDYWTPAAREIERRARAGKNSQTSPVKIKPCSQGVIWRGQLWFWCSKVGYQQGPWDEVHGRPVLHHVIWAEAHRRPVPPHHVIRFADGNPNNLTPENLVLATKNDIARENQAAALQRKSRARTALLLARSQQPHANSHDLLHTLAAR